MLSDITNSLQSFFVACFDKAFLHACMSMLDEIVLAVNRKCNQIATRRMLFLYGSSPHVKPTQTLVGMPHDVTHLLTVLRSQV